MLCCKGVELSPSRFDIACENMQRFLLSNLKNLSIEFREERSLALKETLSDGRCVWGGGVMWVCVLTLP